MAQKQRFSREEMQKRKEAMIKEPGTYVVRGNTLESRAFITLMNEYDTFVNLIKRRVGRPGTDQVKIMEMITKCVTLETEFRAHVKEMREFVAQFRNNNAAGNGNGKGNGNGHGHDHGDETAEDKS